LQQQYIKTKHITGNIKGQKRYFVYQRILDNKLVAIDTIKWMETPLLKAI
jgi:hypothetical protein